MARKLARLYSISKTNSRTGHLRYIYGDNNTLFSGGTYPTKITAEDLPEWYVYGRYYKHFGYLSAKGVKHLLYTPNKWTNHMFKDDCLYISYDKPIVHNPNREMYYDRYTGYDEYIYGFAIVAFLKAAEKYSGYDISRIKDQIEDKRIWFKNNYPDFYELEVPEDAPYFQEEEANE